MRVTKFSDYALRVLIYLACKPDPNLVTIAQLAAAYQISVHHIRMVVHKLGQLGYINNIQGKGGGIELAVDPEEIFIGEVIRQTEKDMFVVECFNPQGSCTIIKACKLQQALGEALNAFLDSLNQYTLADITDNKKQVMKQFNLVQ